MNAFQHLALNLDLQNRDLAIPLDGDDKYFVVDAGSVPQFLEHIFELKEKDMKFSNVRTSKPYSHSLDKATIVNTSNGTVMQQETFQKSTTDTFAFTNTRGYTRAGTITATIGTTLLGGVGTNFNTSFNLSQNATTTASQTTQRAQQQTITVPPNTSLVATWIIKNVDIVADYTLTLCVSPKNIVDYASIPGGVRFATSPITPVYKYIHTKLEAFKYLPQLDLNSDEDWRLASANPIFFMVQQQNQQDAQNQFHFRNWLHAKEKQKIAAPQSPVVSAQAPRRFSKDGWHKRKDSGELDPKLSNVLVPLAAVLSKVDYVFMYTTENGPTNTYPGLFVNSQNVPGTVPLWRYASVDGGPQRHRLETSTTSSPKEFPGWVNEGVIGYVYNSVPAWKPDDPMRAKHQHPLVQITLDKKDKCNKCQRKGAIGEIYYTCETCKATPYFNCQQCYNLGVAHAESVAKKSVAKLFEILQSVGDTPKQLTVQGNLKGTQGTHTYITIDPISEESVQQAKQEMTSDLSTPDAKQSAASPTPTVKAVDSQGNCKKLDDTPQQLPPTPQQKPQQQQLQMLQQEFQQKLQLSQQQPQQQPSRPPQWAPPPTPQRRVAAAPAPPPPPKAPVAAAPVPPPKAPVAKRDGGDAPDRYAQHDQNQTMANMVSLSTLPSIPPPPPAPPVIGDPLAGSSFGSAALPYSYNPAYNFIMNPNSILGPQQQQLQQQLQLQQQTQQQQQQQVPTYQPSSYTQPQPSNYAYKIAQQQANVNALEESEEHNNQHDCNSDYNNNQHNQHDYDNQDNNYSNEDYYTQQTYKQSNYNYDTQHNNSREQPAQDYYNNQHYNQQGQHNNYQQDYYINQYNTQEQYDPRYNNYNNQEPYNYNQQKYYNQQGQYNNQQAPYNSYNNKQDQHNYNPNQCYYNQPTGSSAQ